MDATVRAEQRLSILCNGFPRTRRPTLFKRIRLLRVGDRAQSRDGIESTGFRSSRESFPSLLTTGSFSVLRTDSFPSMHRFLRWLANAVMRHVISAEADLTRTDTRVYHEMLLRSSPRRFSPSPPAQNPMLAFKDIGLFISSFRY